MSDQQQLTLDEVHALTTAALSANGASPDHARAVADTVTAAERDGCKSHGLFRVPGYVASLRSGKVDGIAVPERHELAEHLILKRRDLGAGRDLEEVLA